MADDPQSNRQKRKAARQGAHKLARDPAWKTVQSDPMQRLRELDQQARGERVFDEAQECAACRAAREETGDESALCETHLAEAMGF